MQDSTVILADAFFGVDETHTHTQYHWFLFGVGSRMREEVAGYTEKP